MLMPGEHLSDMEHRYPARKMDDGAPHLVYARPREPGNPEFGTNPGTKDWQKFKFVEKKLIF